MATQFANGKIVTDGLVLSLNAADKNSYPGSGTTWFDTSGNGNNCTLYNGATFNNGNGGNITNDGIDDYVGSPYMSVGTSRTIEIIYNLTSTSGDRGPLWRDDWRERIFPDVIVTVNAGGTYYYQYVPINNTNIQSICYSYSGTSLKAYRNGILIDSQTMDGVMNNNTYYYNFGYQCAGSTCSYAPCRLYSIKMYNRQLLDTEVFQNYNAQKSRFGLK
jgi:hypothetical protein